MILNQAIETERLVLRSLTPEDCGLQYVAWLNDTNVNAYLETRWEAQTQESVVAFVNSMNESEHSLLLGLFVNDGRVHIGNIKLGPTNARHRFADLSYFIGNRAYEGKGLATEAVTALKVYALGTAGLKSVQAGVYEGNVGSIRVLEKSGFTLEGRIKEKLVGPSGREDHLIFSARAAD
jgi:ribosomal-protein-alanine N-acetyltransferase